jgi:hypothetical protein
MQKTNKNSLLGNLVLNKLVFLIIIMLMLLLAGVSAATNVSVLYGWNGTDYIPFQLTTDGKLMTDINKVNLTAGKLIVDTNTLYVDEINNRVGIGTTSPNVKLDVAGQVNSTGYLVNGSTGFTGTCANGVDLTVVGGIITACS